MEPLQAGDPLDEIKKLIDNYKKKHEQLLEEQKELVACRDMQQGLAAQFKDRAVKLAQKLKEEERSYIERLTDSETQLNQLRQEESDLKEKIQMIKAVLQEEEAQKKLLKEQTEVFTAVPEKKVVFLGSTGSADTAQAFEMEANIIYPMEGGTALITFEEEVVATQILAKKLHQVKLGGECSITVEARPVHLMLPKAVEINTDVCPHRILISNLPNMDIHTMLYELEIHFSKSRNGGGEVDTCDLLPDSGNVVLKFVEDSYAKGLAEKELHEVKLQGAKHTVRVTPFLNGKISHFKAESMPCPQTVLLTGIPNVMEPETLQDELEIHFQKFGNGGGEIEAILYNPVGQDMSAVFKDISSKPEEVEEQM
ncbi:interferon-induced 35 kDa protein isoform X2 [Parambassis ranga]|nr:interferon-induced 35 kDa protein isoform X2 [Parambassis ranga]